MPVASAFTRRPRDAIACTVEKITLIRDVVELAPIEEGVDIALGHVVRLAMSAIDRHA